MLGVSARRSGIRAVYEGRGKSKLVVNIENKNKWRSSRKYRGTECAALWKLNSQRIYYSQRSYDRDRQEELLIQSQIIENSDDSRTWAREQVKSLHT
ncbi:hypothetical protein E2C01_058865 [Portunus trituberculatus]|uniref:Uncharacterized protein n=1 Tax=Portunus trituberculatus TaxID=210409 RepID=A0A5B7H5C0_PORTR|nr:hypothetical protein [Portunus trituberculatus]